MPRQGESGQDGPVLLVGIANPATVPRLMGLAANLATCASYRIVVTHVVTVPAQISLATARSSPEVAAATGLLRQAIRAGAGHNIRARGVVEVAREPHEGLVSAAQSREAELMLVGYSDVDTHDGRGERAFDRIMHRVARAARTDMVIAKFRRETFDSVLVPVAGEANLRVTSVLARSISEGAGATVGFLHVVEPEADLTEAEGRFARLLEAHGLCELGPVEIIRTADPPGAIIERANAHDAAIVGAEARPSIAEAIFGNAAERIAAQASCTVLLVRPQPNRDER